MIKLHSNMLIYTLLLFAISISQISAQYKVGVGIADITGPCAEITFMGYANMKQNGRGLHLRQFARSFIFEEGNTRLVYVSIDAGMVGTGMRREVLRKLKNKYGSVYNSTNVILSGTHTHSGPGGFLMDFLFDISILGFVKQTFVAHVDGIVKSVMMAHDSLIPAKIFYNEGRVENANINRSPTSYLLNPEAEKAKYTEDTDKQLVQIKMISLKDSSIIGALSWYAVHPTSMNNTNVLVSSDNVGYASLLLEQALNQPGVTPGKGKFVGAFAATNLGDVSPNIKGPKCEFSGIKCDISSSRCSNHDEQCFASGPGKDMYESTKIIATRIYEVGLNLIQTEGGHEITGPIKVLHQFVDMTKAEVPDYDPVREEFNQKKYVHGCETAMGYSFAAGTTDGPGAFNFSQGTTSGNPLWDSIRDLLAVPTEDDIACHAPKPILLATGRMRYPYKWQPDIVSSQLALLGDLVIAAVPGEFTTMAGRRMRSLLKNTFAAAGKDVNVVIGGLSNTYSDYITTPEEYQAQRYEAASTVYGPHTLTIHLHIFNELAKAMIANEPVDDGPEPEDYSDKLISLVSPVIFDKAPWGLDFGDCVLQPNERYTAGDTVHVKFISGNPRNNLMTENTYLAVERYIQNDDSWNVIATDAHWETRFIWERTSMIMGTSRVNIYWDISSDTPIGDYRIRHFGYFKYIFGSTKAYRGTSKMFKVY